MEEAIQQEMMLEEFEQRHSSTGHLIARVGKLWEGIAEQQQAIIEGRGYKHLGYSAWAEYWTMEWEGASGWKAGTISNWIKARNIKSSTPLAGTGQYEPTGIDQWKELSRLAPEERGDFLDRYEKEYKPTVKGGGHPFREAVKAYRDDHDPTVGEMADTLARSASQGHVPRHYQSRTIARRLRDLSVDIQGRNPEDMAQEMRRDSSDYDVGRLITTIEEVSNWLESFSQGLAATEATVSYLKEVNDDG